jgi:hypothetical protein
MAKFLNVTAWPAEGSVVAIQQDYCTKWLLLIWSMETISLVQVIRPSRIAVKACQRPLPPGQVPLGVVLRYLAVHASGWTDPDQPNVGQIASLCGMRWDMFPMRRRRFSAIFQYKHSHMSVHVIFHPPRFYPVLSSVPGSQCQTGSERGTAVPLSSRIQRGSESLAEDAFIPTRGPGT